MAAALALLGAAANMGACGEPGEPTPSPEPSPDGRLQLSGAVTEARLVMTVSLEAEGLVLAVTEIRNPGGQAFSLEPRLELLDGGPDDAIALNAVSPFPPDQAAEFVIPLPDGARRLIVESGGRVVLVVTMHSLDPGQDLDEELVVTIRPALGALPG